MVESTSTRSLTVTDTLREMLLEGEFLPETRLQEVSLAEKMQVSRTPVREALRVLAKDGLLIYAPNRGYIVRRFTFEDIIKAFRVRAALEGLGARMAAENGLSDEARTELDNCIEEAEELLKTDLCQADNYQVWREMNARFHMGILKQSDNELLMRCAKDSRRIPIVFNGSFKWYAFENFRRSHEHHKMILEAVKNGYGERAEWMMKEHIYSAAEILKEHFKHNEFKIGATN